MDRWTPRQRSDPQHSRPDGYHQHHSLVKKFPRDRRFDNVIRWTRLDSLEMTLPSKKQHSSFVRQVENGSPEFFAFWGGDEHGLSDSSLRLTLGSMELEKLHLDHLPTDAPIEAEDSQENPIRPAASMAQASDGRQNLYFFGGIFKGTDPRNGQIVKGVSNRLHMYNGETGKLVLLHEDMKSPIPCPRFSAAITYVPSLSKSTPPFLYLYGGNDGSGRHTLEDLWAFNLETRYWKCIHDSNPTCGPREGLTMEYWKKPESTTDPSDYRKKFVSDSSSQYLVLYGGSSGKKIAHRDVVLYDIQKDRFTKPNPGNDVPLGRMYHSSMLVSSRLYVFGGWEQMPGSPKHSNNKPDENWKITNSVLCIVLGTEFVRYHELGRDLNDSEKPCPRIAHSFAIFNRIGILYGGIKEELVDGITKNVPLSDIWALEVGAPSRPTNPVLKNDFLVWKDAVHWIPGRSYRLFICKDPGKYSDFYVNKELVYEGSDMEWKIQGLEEGESYAASLDIVTPVGVNEGTQNYRFVYFGTPVPPTDIHSSVSNGRISFAWTSVSVYRYKIEVRVLSLASLERLESRYSRQKELDEVSSYAIEHDAGFADTWHTAVEDITSRLSPSFRSSKIQILFRIKALNRRDVASDWSRPTELVLDQASERVSMQPASKEPAHKNSHSNEPQMPIHDPPSSMDTMEEVLFEGSSTRPEDASIDSMEVVEELNGGDSARPNDIVEDLVEGVSIRPTEEVDPPKKVKPKKVVKINRNSALDSPPSLIVNEALKKKDKTQSNSRKNEEGDHGKLKKKHLKRKTDVSIQGQPTLPQSEATSALSENITAVQVLPEPMEIYNSADNGSPSDAPSDSALVFFNTKEKALSAAGAPLSEQNSAKDPVNDTPVESAGPLDSKPADVVAPLNVTLSTTIRSPTRISETELAHQLFGAEAVPQEIVHKRPAVHPKPKRGRPKKKTPVPVFGKLRQEKDSSTDLGSEEESGAHSDSTTTQLDSDEDSYSTEDLSKGIQLNKGTGIIHPTIPHLTPVTYKKKQKAKKVVHETELILTASKEYDLASTREKFKAMLMNPDLGIGYNLKYGDPCQVLWYGEWYHARAMFYAHADADTLLLKVNYDGWTAKFDNYIIIDERAGNYIRPADAEDIGDTSSLKGPKTISQFDVDGQGPKSHYGLKIKDHIEAVKKDGYLLIPLAEKAKTIHSGNYLYGSDADEGN